MSVPSRPWLPELAVLTQLACFVIQLPNPEESLLSLKQHLRPVQQWVAAVCTQVHCSTPWHSKCHLTSIKAHMSECLDRKHIFENKYVSIVLFYFISCLLLQLHQVVSSSKRILLSFLFEAIIYLP